MSPTSCQTAPPRSRGAGLCPIQWLVATFCQDTATPGSALGRLGEFPVDHVDDLLQRFLAIAGVLERDLAVLADDQEVRKPLDPVRLSDAAGGVEGQGQLDILQLPRQRQVNIAVVV